MNLVLFENNIILRYHYSMKYYGLIGTFLLTFLSLFSIPVLAQPSPVTITPTPVKIEFPQIVAGSDRTINEDVNKDLMLTGGQVTVTSNVNGDAYVVGGQITISGNITQDLIVAGGNVNITGSVGKNLIIAGGQVTISNTAKVGGYVLGAGNLINLNGQFAGPVKIVGNSLIVGDQASIGGNLEADVSMAEVAQTATISGERKINIYENEAPEVSKVALVGLVTAGSIMYFLSKLLVLLLLVYIFKNLIGPATEHLKNFWPALGWGLVVMIVTPFLVIALLATLVGIPLALILLFSYLLVLYLSSMVVATTMGNWMSDKGWLKTENVYIWAIAGLVILSVVGIVPIIGGLVNFVVILLGLGIIFKIFTGNITIDKQLKKISK